MQNLEYAAGAFGYICDWNLLATTNQDDRVMAVKLIKEASKNAFDIAQIKNRRTVRSDFLSEVLKPEDLKYLVNSEPEFIHLKYSIHLAIWLFEKLSAASFATPTS